MKRSATHIGLRPGNRARLFKSRSKANSGPFSVLWTCLTFRAFHLLVHLLFCLSSLAQPRINEVQIAPASAGLEFVEIVVIGDQSIDLFGLTLEDSRAIPVSIAITEGVRTTYDPGEYIVLAQDVDALQSEFGRIENIFSVASWPVLNNGGDAVGLRNRDVLEDRLEYGSGDYQRGLSLERVDPRVPSGVEANWNVSVAEKGATPGSRNSTYSPDTTSVTLESAFYLSDTEIRIRFSEPISSDMTGSGSIRLDGSDYGGTIIFHEPTLMGLMVSRDYSEIVFRSLSDFAGNTTLNSRRTIAQRAARGDLKITEIMFDAGVDPFGDALPEYVEILNTSSSPIATANVFLIVGPPGSTRADVFSIMPGNDEIEAGGVALIYNESDSDAGASGNYSVNYFVDTFETASGLSNSELLIIPVPGGSLSLNNDKDALSIRSGETRIIDSLTYYSAWHDDRLLSTRARSISRIQIDAESDDPLNWMTTDNRLGYSPGYVVETTDMYTGQYPGKGVLHINEILFDPLQNPDDGRADQPEFVEIINVSSWEVDLNGTFLVSGTSEMPARDTLRLVYRPLNLGPGEVAAFYQLPGSVPDGENAAQNYIQSAFPELVTTDSTFLIPLRSSLSLSNAGEVLSLWSANDQLQERLAYSSSWHHSLIADPKGKSVERIDARQPAQMPNNWSTSTVMSGATPGYENSVSFHGEEPTSGIVLDISPLTITPDQDGHDDHARIGVHGGASNSSIHIEIFDLEGRRVRSLVPVALYSGTFTTYWDGLGDGRRALPIGIYIVLARIQDGASLRELSFKRPVALFRL